VESVTFSGRWSLCCLDNTQYNAVVYLVVIHTFVVYWFRMTSKDELMDLVQQCRLSLTGNLPSDIGQLPADLDAILEKFHKIDGEKQ
jgi:hypothetical protein